MGGSGGTSAGKCRSLRCGVARARPRMEGRAGAGLDMTKCCLVVEDYVVLVAMFMMIRRVVVCMVIRQALMCGHCAGMRVHSSVCFSH